MENLFYLSLNWILKIVGLLFLLLFMFMIFSEMANYKKSKVIKASSLAVSMVIALILLLIFDRLYGLNFAPGAKWMYYGLFPVAGVVLGIVSGGVTKLTKQGNTVLGNGVIWYSVLWGLAVAVIQFMALFELYTGISVVMALVIVSTAILVANNFMLILRSNQLK